MLTGPQILDRYFPEVRARLIEVAAVMDRLNRANEHSGTTTVDDERLAMLHESLQVLAENSTRPNKAERIQMIFSDPHPLAAD